MVIHRLLPLLVLAAPLVTVGCDDDETCRGWFERINGDCSPIGLPMLPLFNGPDVAPSSGGGGGGGFGVRP